MRFSGDKLREARSTAKGRPTQIDLAAALRRRGFGTTQTQVSRWEAGQEPRRYIRDALARELGCSVSDFYEESDEDAPLTREEAALLLRKMERLLVGAK